MWNYLPIVYIIRRIWGWTFSLCKYIWMHLWGWAIDLDVIYIYIEIMHVFWIVHVWQENIEDFMQILLSVCCDCFWPKDLRDERPLIYPGRILVPGQVQATKMFWKKSALFTDGRTQQAIQLSGKDMRVIERVGEGQLPSSTDADCTVRGAMKTAQIGPDAASKIFKLLTEIWLKNILGEKKCWIVFHSLHLLLCLPHPFRMACSSQPKLSWKSWTSSQWWGTALRHFAIFCLYHVAQWLRIIFDWRICLQNCEIIYVICWPVQGFLDMQQSSNFPCHLTMFWPDEQTAEWFELTASEILRNKFREGCLKVPGFDRTGLGFGGHVGWLCLWSSTFAESWGKNERNQSVYDGIFCAWLIFNDMFCERMIQVVFLAQQCSKCWHCTSFFLWCFASCKVSGMHNNASKTKMQYTLQE